MKTAGDGVARAADLRPLWLLRECHVYPDPVPSPGRPFSVNVLTFRPPNPVFAFSLAVVMVSN